MGKSKNELRKTVRTGMRKVAIFLPMSRPWRVDAMAKQLSNLDYEGIDPKLVIVVDTDEITEHYVRNALAKYETPGIPATIHLTGNPGASEVNVGKRRERIMNVWNTAKTLIPDDVELVFTIEDDTDVPFNALTALIQDYDNLTANGAKVGLVSGIQVGRWGFKMIGAWRVDDVNNMKTAETIPFSMKHILEKVDAAGFYCFVTPAHLFKSADYIFNQFGADVNYGLQVRQKGFQNYVDWTIKTGHVLQHKTLYPDEKCVVVKYELTDGEWRRTLPTQEGKIS